MQTLEDQTLAEDDTTVVSMTRYLLALDERYDQQARRLKGCIRRAEETEVQIRQLLVQIIEAHARAAAAENRETIAVEALKLVEDRHTLQLKNAYLVT